MVYIIILHKCEALAFFYIRITYYIEHLISGNVKHDYLILLYAKHCHYAKHYYYWYSLPARN